MGCSLKCVDRRLTRSFYRLGVFIAGNPGYFILVPILLAALLATGFQRIDYTDDPEYLFAPVDGRGKQERSVIEEFFPMNYSGHFNPSRMTRPGRFGRVISVAKDGGTILRTKIWDDLLLLNDIIGNITVEYEGKQFTYYEICAMWDGYCLENDILDLYEMMDLVEKNAANLTYPIFLDPYSFKTYVFPMHFGGIEVTEVGTIESVKAVAMSYFIATGNDMLDHRGAVWEDKFLEVLDNTTFETIHVSRFASRTLETELERNTHSIIPYFSVSFGIMLIFTVVTCMMSDNVRSKPYLGLLGLLSAIMATGAGFGLIMYLGLPFIGINLAAPFLMLGIGIDDTFVMIAAWRRTRIQDSIGERLGTAYSEAAVSITITSLTDMLSFWVGAITPFPCVKIFCVYTGTAVVFTYLWHITFFGACMALMGYLEQDNKHAFSCHKVKPLSESGGESSWYRACCAGGVSKKDPYNPIDNKDHWIMMFFRDKVSRFLSIPAIKAFVLMVFLIYIGIAAWGITRVQEGLERRRLSRYDSYSIEYYDLEDTLFRKFPYRVQVVVTGDLEYSNPETQVGLEMLLQKFENSSYIGPPLFTESWLRQFIGFVDRNKEFLGLNITTEKQFIQHLRELYLSGPNNVFALDVKFNQDYTKIIASRFVLQVYDLQSANDDRLMMEEIRQISDQSVYNVSVFHPYFVFFDQFVMVRSITMQAVGLAAIVMMIISLIFIPHPMCSLWVAFSIVSIEVGVVGYMSLWKVNLDSISMINLIMCIGFSVDFSAHISYSFMAAEVDSPRERMRNALHNLGLPILQSSASTVLGIVSLAVAPSYIFKTFFKVVFLVIFFGALHGLFLLPVLLSIFGPGSCRRKEKSSPQKTLTHPFFSNSNGRIPSAGADNLGFQVPRPRTNLHEPVAKYSNGLAIERVMHPGRASSTPGTYDSPKSNDAPEKDLGLGTSGEDSSEASLSKTGVAPVSKNGRSPFPLLEMYNNAGYISDDEIEHPRRTRNSPAHERLRNGHVARGSEPSLRDLPYPSRKNARPRTGHH